jgi:hypothetical protein
VRGGTGSETEPCACGGGIGDGAGDGSHQAGVAGPGGAGQLDRTGGTDGNDQTPVGERLRQAGRGVGVLVCSQPAASSRVRRRSVFSGPGLSVLANETIKYGGPESGWLPGGVAEELEPVTIRW